MRALSRIAVGLVAALAARTAQAQVHAHQGFFLRLDVGGGYLEQRAPTNSTLGDMKVSGGAGAFGVAVGGAVAENLVLAGHLFSNAVSNPSISFSNGSSGSTNDTTSSLVGIGPALTYYFMPVNVYLSGTLAATRLSLRVNGQDANSDWGVGTRLALGKEWWVSDSWGLGLAGQFSWSSNKDQGTGAPTIATWGLGLAFSATYN